ncbi:ComC/BlpC family leader-containing pheromone/bacteriocin [Marinifilum sp. RC60d5]
MNNFETLSTEDLKNTKGGMQDKVVLDDILV